MLDEGVLDASGERAIAAYAIHVGPGPRGVFATKNGCATAGSNQMYVTIRGRGGHGSSPHLALDPVPVAAPGHLGHSVLRDSHDERFRSSGRICDADKYRERTRST
jgi:metal-dependent amidase/aminoacylase/carboxypeptidase family protein